MKAMKTAKETLDTNVPTASDPNALSLASHRLDRRHLAVRTALRAGVPANGAPPECAEVTGK